MTTRASEIHGLAAYHGKPPLRTSQIAALLAYAPPHTEFARAGELTALVVHTPPATKYVRDSQTAGLVVYAKGVYAMPRASQLYALAVYRTSIPDSTRQRAWTFVLDGHQFYVLDLGNEGTFLYDIGTGQWCEFKTQGHNGWNVKNGVSWGSSNRIVGGDEFYPYVWEMDPDQPVDEGFRDIIHKVTGGIMTRSRVFHAVEMLRIAGSLGKNTSDSGATMTMRFSDDMGGTWSDTLPIALDGDAFPGEISWTSLGSFMAPGRVFEFSDVGGLLRIDGADLFAEDFDADQVKGVK